MQKWLKIMLLLSEEARCLSRDTFLLYSYKASPPYAALKGYVCR